MKRWPMVVAGFLVALVLTGCAKAPPVPVDRFYRLPEPSVAALGADRTRWGQLVHVRALQADGLHTERAVLFSEDVQAVSLVRYHYHHWVDGPPRLVQDYVATSLRQAVPSALILTEPDGRPDVVVSGKVKRFEHHVPLGKGEGRAMVALELRVSRASGSAPVWVKDYQAVVDVRGVGMTATINAFGQAMSDIVSAFVADASSALAP